MSSELSQRFPILEEVSSAARAGDLDLVYEKAMAAVRTIMDVEVGSLQLLDEESQGLRFAATLIPEELTKLQEADPIPINENSVSGYVAKYGAPKMFADAWADPVFGERQRRMARDVNDANRSFVCVPLRGRDRVIGVLSALHAEPSKFTEAELNTALSLADFVAHSIESARENAT